MRRGGIEPPAPRRCWMATENFTTKPSTLDFVRGLLTQEPRNVLRGPRQGPREVAGGG
ncbi:hypothetical protein CABS02_01761 [Colletotrichum abscissum]|uniref:Uncharacterized protein n=1 Tax=Colletotrichum abscissum TaxID=1671311 RepID=A0A9P9XR39_9PEZI|nr:hypothetical protein CABS02_01761 [Colletotrichum abscissum]